MNVYSNSLFFFFLFMSSYSSYRNVTRCFTQISNTLYFIENPSTVHQFHNLKKQNFATKENTHILNVCLNCLMQRYQGPFVRTRVSASPGLNFNPGFFIFLSKALSRIIFFILFRVSNYQIVG